MGTAPLGCWYLAQNAEKATIGHGLSVDILRSRVIADGLVANFPCIHLGANALRPTFEIKWNWAECRRIIPNEIRRVICVDHDAGWRSAWRRTNFGGNATRCQQTQGNEAKEQG